MQDEDYYPSFDDPDTFMQWPCGENHNTSTGIWLDGYTPGTNANLFVGNLYTVEEDEKYKQEMIAQNEINIANYYGVEGNASLDAAHNSSDPPPAGQTDRDRNRDRRDGRTRRIDMSFLQSSDCAGVVCLEEDPIGDGCVMPSPLRHACIKYSKNLFGTICQFQMLKCGPVSANAWAGAPFY